MMNTVAAAGMALAMLTSPFITSSSTRPAAEAASAAATPNARTIEVVTVNGSGCPAGTADAWTSTDGGAVLVRFREFDAQAGGGTPPIDQRENCQIALRVATPSGWSFALQGIDAFGYADLAPGATGIHRTTAYFAGETEESRVSRTIPGPRKGTWQTSDTFPSLVYSPCSAARNLNINTELRVQAGSSERASYIDMQATIAYRFTWRRC